MATVEQILAMIEGLGAGRDVRLPAGLRHRRRLALQSLGERARSFLEAARGHRRAPVRKAAEKLLAPSASGGAARRGPAAKRR